MRVASPRFSRRRERRKREHTEQDREAQYAKKPNHRGLVMPGPRLDRLEIHCGVHSCRDARDARAGACFPRAPAGGLS